MKKLSILFIFLFVLSGCLKRDVLEDIDIYTTTYPIEYITERLYGKHSNVFSIYPDGVNVYEYELNEKQIKDYSKSSLFVFNALSKEKDYVIPMFNYNKNIKIIDSSLSMTYDYEIEELWLNPSNFLMLAQNIKMGLNDYINSHYLKNEIEGNYQNLYIEVSNIDANIKQISENATHNVVVVSHDLFKFLEKYNLEVISVEENEFLNDKKIANVIDLINDNVIEHIFVKDDEELSDTIKKIQKQTNVKIKTIHSLSNLSDKERKEKMDYLTIMNEFVQKLKEELYG